MQNIILVNSQGISKAYGIGAYVEYLTKALAKQNCINLIYVEVGYADKGEIEVTKNHFTTIKITLKGSYSNINSSSAQIIFNSILLNSNIESGIFHLNLTCDIDLARIAKQSGFKIVLTQHTSLTTASSDQNYTLNYLGKIDREMYSIIDGCIFLSEETKKIANTYFLFPSSKSTVIYNGIQWKPSRKSKHILKKQLGFHRDDFIAIFVGRLEKSKGIYDLVEAFIKFAKGDPSKKLIVVGSGNFHEILKKSKKSLNNVLFTGYVNRDELAEYYKIADIGILPSFSEQSSLAVVEMIHNDIPLILTDINGFKVFKDDQVLKTPINDDNNTRTIDMGKLTSNIQTLFKNENIRKELVEKTYDYKNELMNINFTTLKTIEFYDYISTSKTS